MKKKFFWQSRQFLLLGVSLLFLVGFAGISLLIDHSLKQAFRASVVWAGIYDPPPPPSPPPPSSPTPPPTGGYCGDGSCSIDEDSQSCSQDCGIAECENPCGDVCCDGDVCREEMGCWEDLPPGDPTGGCTSSSDCSCSCPSGFDCAGVHCINGGCISDCTESEDPTDPDPTPPCFNTVPEQPTLVSPINGDWVLTEDAGGGLVKYTLTWDDLADDEWGINCDGNVNNYAVYIGYDYEDPVTTQVCWVSDGAGPTVTCDIDNGGSRSWLFTPGTTYRWRVEANNGVKFWSSSAQTFQLGGEISGTVYEDTTKGACSTSSPTGSGWGLTCDGVAVSTDGSGNFTCVDASGEDALVGGSHTLNLTPSGTYQLSCNPYGTWDVTLDAGTPNITDYNLMVTQARDAWFQAQGGGLHADSTGGGVTVQSEIPDTCSLPDCDPNLVKRDLVTGQAGAVSRASGSQEFGSGSVSADGWQAEAGSYEGVRADYDFWRQHLSDELVDWDGIGEPANEFSLASTDDVSIGSNWNVGESGSEKRVVLVPNNVEINANQTVAEGSSLLIIAGGTISFDSGVTRAEGIYVANYINTGTGGVNNDSQFIGEGTFIGWDGITLARDLGASGGALGEGNRLEPGELFVYRPDIVYNLPTEVKRPLYTWREVP